MEGLPKPDLSHYVGRNVIAVEEHGLDWDIVLEGDVRIRNEDKRRTMPTNLEGAAFQTVTLSEGVTTMMFSNGEQIRLTPVHYSIIDSRHEAPVHPQRRDPEEDQMIAEKFKVPVSEVEPQQPVTPLPDEDALDEGTRDMQQKAQKARAKEGDDESS